MEQVCWKKWRISTRHAGKLANLWESLVKGSLFATLLTADAWSRMLIVFAAMVQVTVRHMRASWTARSGRDVCLSTRNTSRNGWQSCVNCMTELRFRVQSITSVVHALASSERKWDLIPRCFAQETCKCLVYVQTEIQRITGISWITGCVQTEPAEKLAVSK